MRYTISVLLLTLAILSGKPALAAVDDHEHIGLGSANADRQSGLSVAPSDADRAKPRPNLAGSSYGAEGLPEPYSSGLFFNIFKLL